MSGNHDEDNLNAGPRFEPQLYLQRYQAVYNVLLKEVPPILKVADFGCAEGRFLRYLKKLPFAEEISCIDVDKNALEECDFEAKPGAWDIVFGRFVGLNVNLFNGSVTEPDSRLQQLDAVTCIELVEHLHPETLGLFPSNIFGTLSPRLVIVTTPNKEYNVCFPQLKDTDFRHWDHKFEWTRDQFIVWCDSIVKQFPNYSYETRGVGDPPKDFHDVGFCSQIAVFRRKTGHDEAEANVVDMMSNYSLYKSYHYPKRVATETKKGEQDKEEEEIDWDVVLGRHQE